MEEQNQLSDSITGLLADLQKQVGAQTEAAQANLDMQQTLAQDKNAVQANSAGLLYSNLAPTRDLQWNSDNYYPNVAKNQQTYLTTMDSIISKGRQFSDQMGKLSEKIIEANSDL